MAERQGNDTIKASSVERNHKKLEMDYKILLFTYENKVELNKRIRKQDLKMYNTETGGM